jgi:hypothetical protein
MYPCNGPTPLVFAPGQYAYIRYIQYATLSASASDPFFQGAAPPATQSVSVMINLQTGMASGTVTHTNFPAVQIFINNQPVYNYSANQNGMGSLDIYSTSTHQFSAPIADPAR